MRTSGFVNRVPCLVCPPRFIASGQQGKKPLFTCAAAPPTAPGGPSKGGCPHGVCLDQRTEFSPSSANASVKRESLRGWGRLLRCFPSAFGTSGRIDYVANNAAAWTFPGVANETPEDRERALADWERHVATLDTAVLSLIGENDIPDDGVAAALDDILQSSLWHRRLLRQNEQVQQVLKAGLVSRGRLIWSQSTAARRRGYFLAGVGLETGLALDGIAGDANLLLVQANGGILNGDVEAAIAAIADRVFAFYPFTPDPMPANWREILRAWISASLSSPSLPVRSRRHCSSLRADSSTACHGRWRPFGCVQSPTATPSTSFRSMTMSLPWRWSP